MIQKVNARDFSDDVNFAELTETLKATKTRKAIGVDGFNAKHSKYGGLILYLRFLLHVYNEC